MKSFDAAQPPQHFVFQTASKGKIDDVLAWQRVKFLISQQYEQSDCSLDLTQGLITSLGKLGEDISQDKETEDNICQIPQ